MSRAVANASGNGAATMKIRIRANCKSVMATLLDNAAARDFHASLPLTLTLEDYAATEKIAYLPKKLSTEDAPAGFDPSIGDLAYYAPWGNVAIFHKDAPYARGLVHLGHVDSGLEAVPLGRPVQVRIETADRTVKPAAAKESST